MIFWDGVIIFVLSLHYNCNAMITRGTLDLNGSLSVFENCTVHIMMAILMEPDQQTVSHELIQLHMPVMHSSVGYSANKKGTLECNMKTRYSLATRGFKSQARPFYKLTCLVEVYIDPPSCKQWTKVMFGKLDVWDSFGGIRCKILPRSFQNLRTPLLVKHHHFEEVTVVKHNWAIVHIEATTNEPRSYSGLPDTVFFHCMCETQYGMYSTAPSKIIMEIEMSKNLEKITITASYIASVQEIMHEVHLVNLKCRRYGETMKAINCFNINGGFFKGLHLIRYAFSTGITLTTFSEITKKPIKDLVAHYTETESDVYTTTPSISRQFLEILFENGTIDTDYILFGMGLVPSLKTYDRFMQGQVELPYLPHFLSCTSLRKYTGFSLIGFVSAFDYSTWIYFIIFSLITTAILQRSGIKSGGFWLELVFSYDILVGKPIKMMVGSKQLLSPWTVVGVLLSMLYQGKNIASFVSQLEPKPLTEFYDLFVNNFTLFSLPNSSALVNYKLNILNPERVQKVFEMFSDNRFPLEMDDLNFWNWSLANQVVERPSNLAAYLNWTVEKQAKRFAKCSRHAFISNYDQIVKMHEYLDTNKMIENENDLHISTKSSQKQWYLWIFESVSVSADYFAQRLGMLMQSGILSMLSDRKKTEFPIKGVSALRRYKGKREDDLVKPKPLHMGSNVVAAFLVWAVMLGLVVLGFTIETRNKTVDLVLMLIWIAKYKIRQMFRKLKWWYQQIMIVFRGDKTKQQLQIPELW